MQLDMALPLPLQIKEQPPLQVFDQLNRAVGLMTSEVAVEHGNRTRQERLSAHLTGFEDRAGHQARMLYRARIYKENFAAPPKNESSSSGEALLDFAERQAQVLT